jgi:hypothetical protein
MHAWATLFERAREYDTDLEAIRETLATRREQDG